MVHRNQSKAIVVLWDAWISPHGCFPHCFKPVRIVRTINELSGGVSEDPIVVVFAWFDFKNTSDNFDCDLFLVIVVKESFSASCSEL